MARSRVNLPNSSQLKVIVPTLFFISLGLGFSPASAHTVMVVENIEIDVGWQEEPPVVGLLNAITIEINEIVSEGIRSGITNAFKDLQASVYYGGISKDLNINSETKPGHYYSKILPTKTGTIIVKISGEINQIPIELEIPIEDVESQAVLAFPFVRDASSGDISSIKNAISSMSRDLALLKVRVDEINPEASEHKGAVYDLAIFGLSLGAAGVVLAIVAMTKTRKNDFQE